MNVCTFYFKIITDWREERSPESPCAFLRVSLGECLAHNNVRTLALTPAQHTAEQSRFLRKDVWKSKYILHLTARKIRFFLPKLQIRLQTKSNHEILNLQLPTAQAFPEQTWLCRGLGSLNWLHLELPTFTARELLHLFFPIPFQIWRLPCFSCLLEFLERCRGVRYRSECNSSSGLAVKWHNVS